MLMSQELTADLEMHKLKLGAAEDIQAIYEARCLSEQREAEMLVRLCSLLFCVVL